MPTTTSPIAHVTDDHFAAEVLEADRPVLVDFTASWCAPCRVMAPVLDELALARPESRVVKVDLDANQETAARYGVLAAPTLILFRDGSPALTLVGARPLRRLNAELEAAL